MMKAFIVEFEKIRRRRNWLFVFLLILVEILWSIWAVSRMDDQDLQQGWFFTMYQFPLLNSIVMPLIAAVVASRLSDIEHKGQSFRLLRTIQPAGSIFDAKFLCGAVFMWACALLQTLMIVIIGCIAKFKGVIPFTMLGEFLLFTISVDVTILLLQQTLSLLFNNQMVSLSVGLIGAFSGLFSMYLPLTFQKFLIWSYYGVMMFIRMDWNHETRVTNFYAIPVDWTAMIFLLIFFMLIYIIGRYLFVKKEI